MPRRSRPVRSRARVHRFDGRVTTPEPTGEPFTPEHPAAPPPRVMAPAQHADTPVTTKITTTDFGYVVGELKRIAILTVIIIVTLFVLWFLLG